MLETVKVRKQGYPVRFAFADFVERFQYVLPPKERKLSKNKSGCSDLVNAVGLSKPDFIIGKTKVSELY